MRYEEINKGSNYPYPNHSDKVKGADWCLQYARAAYFDFMGVYPKGVFYTNGGDYEKFRMYALAKQPNSQYKSMLGVDMQTLNTQMVVDWTNRAIVSGYRDKAISRLMKEDWNIVCTPIDSQSKDNIDKFYQEMRTKIVMREVLQQQGSELANHPLIQIQSGEPMDLEELEMRIMNGEQFNRSMDAEMAIELGLYENNFRDFLRSLYEDLFDFGVGGYREWLGEDNKAKFEKINAESVICSYAKDGTFSDMVHAGPVIDVSLVDLAAMTDDKGDTLFTEDELTEFAGSVAGKWGNPSMANMSRTTGFLKPYDPFKCKVLDIYFYTYNEQTYTDRTDSNGNAVFRMEVSGRGELTNARYKRKRIKYVYKCKWIIGTDKCYDYGMCYDQKRTVDNKKKALTTLPIKLIAYNFYEMRAQGYMERLIPFIDDYQLTTLRIQNWKNRAIPSGWWIDMDKLENVAKNKGGANMTPQELIQMLVDTGILLGRSLDDAGSPLQGNIQPIIPMANNIMTELVGLCQDLERIVYAIEKMTGYNDVTSGNPNPKTLVPGLQEAIQSTNDALYPLAWAAENITLRLCEDVLCRMKQGIRKGGVEGYAPYSGALGNNTVRFISLDNDLSLRDHGIMLQKRTTDAERQYILQLMQQDIVNGFLDTSDVIAVLYVHNPRQAISILAYRVKKAKEKISQQELAKIQTNNEGQLAQQKAQQQFLLQQQMNELQSKEAMKQMEVEGELNKVRENNAAQIQMNQATNESRVAAAHDTGTSKIISTDLAGQHASQKQQIANEKETATG